MRILFKTSYLDDIRLFQHNGQRFWYGLLVASLVLAPLASSGETVHEDAGSFAWPRQLERCLDQMRAAPVQFLPLR